MNVMNIINRIVGEEEVQPETNKDVSDKPVISKNEVLIIEDDELTRRLIERVLKREFNVDVVSHSNGMEGLHYAEEHVPYLIVLDLMLPGINGFDILKKIRKDPRFEHTRVVLVSAKSRSEDIEKGFDLTADAYITKPFDPREFLASIRELLKKAA
jgi:DNA-binding response OmpR family regulator